ncbi:DUF4089 domain-containing protein [Rhodobacterales bacterium HKCCE2091]|nr:DUF4089 domain-containing protein [Rhodobacterales bacterium HKCCE2091]
MSRLDNGAYIDAAADLVGLPLRPEWRPGVARFVALAAGMAEVLDRVDLDDAELVQAPVYTLPDMADDRD